MLKQGGTIGIFTSSYPITATAPDATQRAITYLEGNGYRIKFGSLTGKREFYRSGTARERAQEFNELLYDPEVSCLMATIGGMVSNAMLPYIDYDYLAAHPKIIVGHSDITALLLGIYQKTGLITYYGPNLVTTFAQPEPLLSDSLSCLQSVLSAEQLPYTYALPSVYCPKLPNLITDASGFFEDLAAQGGKNILAIFHAAAGQRIDVVLLSVHDSILPTLIPHYGSCGDSRRFL